MVFDCFSKFLVGSILSVISSRVHPGVALNFRGVEARVSSLLSG